MKIQLISENAKKGTAQVVVVYEEGRSVTRHLQGVVGRNGYYTDKGGVVFVRSGGIFAIVK